MDKGDGRPRCVLCGRILEERIVPDVPSNGKLYDVYYCSGCKVGMTVPTPSAEDLAGIYASGKYRSRRGRRFFPLVEWFILAGRLFRRRRIERHRVAGSILDVGCGRGIFLHVMRKAGWAVAGVESSQETAEEVSGTYGLKVATGEQQGWGFLPGSFDVVTMNHVLEHVVDPGGLIEACHRMLKPGGLLVVSVPNLGSLQAKVGKGGWFHLDVPGHLLHFSRDGLRSFLEGNRFSVVQTRNFDAEYNVFGWIQTLLNVSGIRRNLLYEMLKRKELREREEGRLIPGRVASLVFLPLLLPIALLLSLLESFLPGGGGTVEMFAIRKPTEGT